MQIPLLMDRSQTGTLAAQIEEQLREAIRSGRIAVGARLPSSRLLSDQLQVSRNTVIRAYEVLCSESWLETRPASGIFVATRLPEGLMRPPPGIAPSGGAPDGAGRAAPLPALQPRAPVPRGRERPRLAFDFFPGRPNPGLFPLKIWRRLLNHALSHGGAVGLTQDIDPAGLPKLRAAIAGHLAANRGIVADPARIVVTAGAQDAIGIAARLFLGPHAAVVVENPCRQGAAFAFEASGAEVIAVAVDGNGLRTDDLPEAPVALVCVSPSHHFPTGQVLSASRRLQLAAWARRNGAYVLEDDRGCDFRYEGSPLPAIAAAVPDRTIYLGSFAEALGAGLCLGYAVVPPHLVGAFSALRALTADGTSWLDQTALAEMMRTGSYDAHVRRVRAQYRASRDALLAALHRYFGRAELSGEGGGLHVFWTLAADLPDAAALEELARRARVGLCTLAGAGAHDAHHGRAEARGIVLGYATLAPHQIEEGLGRLARAVEDSRPRAAAHGEPHLVPRIAQPPALRGGRAQRPLSHFQASETDSAMPVLVSLYHYPIKGLSPQPVAFADLVPGQPFPHDRIFAMARPGSRIDPAAPRWAKKGLFVNLMLDEALAHVQTRLDVNTLRLRILQGEQELLCAQLDRAGERAEVESYFHRLVPNLRGAPCLVHAPSGHFMDKPDNVLSLINLATLRSLEEAWGYRIDPLRFRANFYIDGARPWEEFDWIGSDLRIGDVTFRVDRRNGRCGATNVNPASGRRDLDIPGSLRAAFGHKDLGVYLVVRDGGRVAAGATMEVPERTAPAAASVPVLPVVAAGRRFICQGCYFIYQEDSGLPQQDIPAGTAFSAIPPAWRCPDCGTDKTTFRPYLLPVVPAQA